MRAPSRTTAVGQTPRSVDVRRRSGVASLIGVVLLVLAVAPWVLGSFEIGVLARVLVLGLLAMSVALLTGVTGLPTLAQAGYFGVGAYTAAIVARSVTEVGPVQLVVAAAVAALAAAITGVIAIRARGVAFLMITLAIGEIMYNAAISWSSVTDGSDGLSGIPHVIPFWGLAPLTVNGFVYYYILVLFLVLYALIALLLRSPFGLALRGIRDNEDRMRSVGYPVTRYLMAGYCAAGALAGAAGAMWVSLHRFMSPGEMAFDVAALALLAAVIGGGGSMWGACVGAALVVFMRDYLGGVFAGQGMLLLGLTFVAVVYLLPRGLSGIRWRRIRTRGNS